VTRQQTGERMKREEFEAIHGPVGKNVTYIDLDDPTVNPQPVITAGWTDEQIKNKSALEFDEMIASAEMNIRNIERTVEGEKRRLHDLQALKNRRLQLGA